MGSYICCLCCKKKKSLSNAKKINNIINDNDNDNNNLNQNQKKLNISNFNNDINSNIQKIENSINEIQKNLKELKNNKINNMFNRASISSISNDFILNKMKEEFIKKKKNKFKNEIITYLKNKFINPLFAEIKNLEYEIKNLKSIISTDNKKIKKPENENEIFKKKFENINIDKEKLNDQLMMKDNEFLNISKRQCKLKLKFSEKKYARVGLNNIGNNCYINSVLQILKNIPKFTYNLSKINNNSDKFLNSLKDLLINICKSNISSFSPIEFKTNLGLENKRFSGNNQYDSTIFYVSLLNIINKKLNKANKDNYKKIDMKQYDNKNLQERFEIWKKNYLSKNQTFIFDLFYIYFINEIECNYCKNKTHTFQSMNFFDFPIITENSVIKNLKECFENYQMKKSIDICSKCYKAQLTQQFIIIELPPVLIINLKRVGEKNVYYNEIDIPLQLNMEEIIKQGKNNSIYELRGFIKHFGDEKSGHNYSICKNMFDDKWYSYNDSICKPIDNELKLDKIFFLCYIQIGSKEENIEYLNKIIDILNEN